MTEITVPLKSRLAYIFLLSSVPMLISTNGPNSIPRSLVILANWLMQ